MTSGAARAEYEQRVNEVIDHVRDHLAEDLPLERLARIGHLSPFHFHRVFRAVTGETLAAFVQRLRLERAAVALIHHADQSVLAVALDHGFMSAAGFARAFRAHFGTTATAWRAKGSAQGRQSDPQGAQSTAARPGAGFSHACGRPGVAGLPCRVHAASRRSGSASGSGRTPRACSRLIRCASVTTTPGSPRPRSAATTPAWWYRRTSRETRT